MLKDGKSLDPQGAIAEMIKGNADLWATLMALPMNASFREGRLSVAQRFGLLALVCKKGDATDLANYRGLGGGVGRRRERGFTLTGVQQLRQARTAPTTSSLCPETAPRSDR